jgi:hypothetical protein
VIVAGHRHPIGIHEYRLVAPFWSIVVWTTARLEDQVWSLRGDALESSSPPVDR